MTLHKRVDEPIVRSLLLTTAQRVAQLLSGMLRQAIEHPRVLERDHPPCRTW